MCIRDSPRTRSSGGVFSTLGRGVAGLWNGIAHLLGGAVRSVGRAVRDIDPSVRRDGAGLALVAVALVTAAASWFCLLYTSRCV